MRPCFQSRATVFAPPQPSPPAGSRSGPTLENANQCDCSGYDNMSGFNVNFTRQQTTKRASMPVSTTVTEKRGWPRIRQARRRRVFKKSSECMYHFLSIPLGSLPAQSTRLGSQQLISSYKRRKEMPQHKCVNARGHVVYLSELISANSAALINQVGRACFVAVHCDRSGVITNRGNYNSSQWAIS